MLDLSLPPGEGPFPLVVFIHGGAWYLGTPKYSNPTLRGVQTRERLIAARYAVARISYRLTREAIWPAQLHDCNAAIRYLNEQAETFHVDPERMSIIGESAGGHLAAMVALTGSDRRWAEGETAGVSGVHLKAVVNWYGVMDLNGMSAQRGNGSPRDVQSRPEELLVGDDGHAGHQRMRAASPINYVRNGLPPFLHQHGDKDRVVPLSQAEAMHQALVDAGTHSELHVVSGADHCFWGGVSAEIMDRTIVFLDEHLLN